MILYISILCNILIGNIIEIPNDFPTIQDGVDYSNNGDTILVNPGVYNENILIDEKELIIISNIGRDSTIIDGNSNGPVITFNNINAENTLLSGFTIQNGTGAFMTNSNFGGGILCKYSMPKLNDLIIQNNTAFAGGGICYYAIDSTNNTPIISNSIIKNNLASEGGGIFAINHHLTIENTDIHNNGMDLFGSGGGIQILLGSLTMNDVNIQYNETRFGGGIYISNSNATLQKININNNYAEAKGGGIWIGGNTNINFEKALIYNNQSNNGGGIFTSNSNININHTTITDNSVTPNSLGAGIYMNSGNATINNSIIYFNYSQNTFNNPNYNLGGYSNDNFSEYDITYSNIQGVDNWVPSGVGIISESPLFVNSNNDYNLLLTSPCIDSGDPALYDLDGTRSDMGALYYNQQNIGDVNNDSIINILDIVVLVNLILSNQYDINGDLNSDNTINIQDVVLLVNMIL